MSEMPFVNQVDDKMANFANFKNTDN